MRRPYNFQCSDENHPVFSVALSFAENDAILEDKININCPICNGKANKTIKGCTLTSYIRGQGIVLDKEGAKREANLWQLENDDPYEKFRKQSGESKSDAVDRVMASEKFSKQRQPDTTIKYDAATDTDEESYQYCPSCKKTMVESVFKDGTDYRCDSCTASDIRPEYQLQYDSESKKYMLKWS